MEPARWTILGVPEPWRGLIDGSGTQGVADGRELTAEMRADRPEIPILLASGYALDATVPGDDRPATGYLPKPFTPAQLLAAVGHAVRASRIRAA